MIVDDMHDIHEVFKEVLQLHGHQVIFSAKNGQEAVEYMKNPATIKPELIIMDQLMPRKDGLTALKEILSLDSQQKIIFASADPSSKKKVLKEGAKEYLVKPFSVKTLLRIIAHTVNNF